MSLSMMGLYDWDSHIFDGLQVPEGVNRQTVVDSILLETAELEVIYPQPATMQEAITLWSGIMLPSWQRIHQALTEDYDPLHNYDRHEDWTDATVGSSKNRSRDSTAGWNQSQELADRSQIDQEGSAKGETRRTGRAYGNIGVTTSAQMLDGEISIRQQHPSIISIITQQFRERFCLLVY